MKKKKMKLKKIIYTEDIFQPRELYQLLIYVKHKDHRVFKYCFF